MPWMIPAAALVGTAVSYKGGKERNKAQVGSAREQMEFQREMSNTAHQRQVEDLKAAGLNPILSAKYGGASSPGGAQAQIQDALTPAVNTGLQTLQMTNTANVAAKTADVLMEQVYNVNADTWLKRVQSSLSEISFKEKQAVLKILAEDLKTAKRKGQMDEIKFNALKEGLTTLTDEFPALKFLFGD